MSATLFAGVKPGYGPVLKIMADAAYNPETTPNTDYAKFRFNSEVEEIGYTYGVVDGSWTASQVFARVPWNSTGSMYWPTGSNASTCQFLIDYQARGDSSSRRIAAYPAYDRLTSMSYRPILVRYRNRSAWLSNWFTERGDYTGSTDKRYVSFNENTIDLTDQLLSTGTNLGLTFRNDSWRQSTNALDNLWFNARQSLLFTTVESGDPPVDLHEPFIETELPMENDPYPEVSPPFTEGVPCLHLGSTLARMAKPGFNVDTANRNQMIFSHDKAPIKCVRTGSFTIAPSATVNIDIEFPITPNAWVEDQINITGEGLRLPPYPTNNTQEILLEHRIVGQQLQYRNQSAVSLDCRFFVMSDADAVPSVGNAPVLDETDGLVRILRPGTAGISPADIILDSRCATLPLVAQGWVSGSALTATTSDNSRYGTHMHTVTFANNGWKPMVLAMARYTRNGKYIYQGLFAKNIEIYDYMSASTFMCTVTDTQVRFYYTAASSSRYEDAYRIGSYQLTPMQMQLNGFRYYVFAVPPTL